MFGVWDHYREVARIGTPGGCVLCGGCASCYNDPMNRRTTTIALAVVQIDGDETNEPRYLYGPFDQAPGFAEVGRNLNLAELLERSGSPS